jgi:hypothetical protein
MVNTFPSKFSEDNYKEYKQQVTKFFNKRTKYDDDFCFKVFGMIRLLFLWWDTKIK